MAAARKTASKAPAARPEPIIGIYRCPHPHPVFAGRPCNKFLGYGRGEFTRTCPRCNRACAFLNPNDPAH